MPSWRPTSSASSRKAASRLLSPVSQRPPGRAHWPPCPRNALARRVSRKPAAPAPWPSATTGNSVMATAAGFRPEPPGGAIRLNAAQRSATCRREASVNGQHMLCPYRRRGSEGRYSLPRRRGRGLVGKQEGQQPALLGLGRLRVDAARHVRLLIHQIALDAVVDAVVAALSRHPGGNRAELLHHGRDRLSAAGQPRDVGIEGGQVSLEHTGAIALLIDGDKQ